MRFLGVLAVVSGLAAWLSPATAGAQSGDAAARVSPPPLERAGCVSRPDVAVLDEYCGALPTPDDRGLVGPPLQKVLPAAIVRQLKAAGPLGEVLLALRLAVVSGRVADRRRGKGLDADDLLRSGRLGGKPDHGRNVIEAVANAMTGGLVGAAFGTVLLLSAFGLGGASWLRLRRRHGY